MHHSKGHIISTGTKRTFLHESSTKLLQATNIRYYNNFGNGGEAITEGEAMRLTDGREWMAATEGGRYIVIEGWV